MVNGQTVLVGNRAALGLIDAIERQSCLVCHR